mmetsp:Transcript_23153/g.64167  ORF Transcript_23153/g.64167 Transcript_23153/m.64167 type:complete len:2474 (+) Transcript_23153:109-7530(+)
MSVKLICIPWAGGTSRVYSKLLKEIEYETSGLHLSFEPHLVDLPGRFLRAEENAVTDISAVAEVVIDEALAAGKGSVVPQRYALLGHSYGAIVAFEVARRAHEKGIQRPLFLFVSASRPPSSKSLTSSDGKPVSSMDLNEMRVYFKNRGSEMTFDFQDEEVTNLFCKSVHADYEGLETYVSNTNQIDCPIFAIGGDSDCIVSEENTLAWNMHTTAEFNSRILPGKGHFYLDEDDAAKTLASVIVKRIQDYLEVTNKTMMETIRMVYSKVLNMESDQISIDSDFFELGGSSLDTITLISQIQAIVGVHISQNEFFLNPKVKELACRVNEIKESSSEMPKLEPIDGSHDCSKWFPPSPGQEQMFTCWEMSPAMYNMPTTIEFIDCSVDRDKLEHAIEHVVKQQPSLRTIVAIDPRTNDIKQKVLPHSRAKDCFELVVSIVDSDEEARCLIEEESLFIFPLSSGPIVRGVIVEVKNGSSFLLLNQHHIGSDGWSTTVLRRHLLRVYLALRSNQKAENVLEIHSFPNYVDWTMWQSKRLKDFGQHDEQLAYWREKLKLLPALDLPTDKPRPKTLSSRGMCIPIQINEVLTERFAAFVASRGANLYAGLIALYVLMLNRMGGGDDFAIGIALANRHHEGLRELIGYFANEVAIRATFDAIMSFNDVLKMIRQNVLEGMANADVPFHKVTEALRISRDNSRTSVFQAMFALQEREWHSLDDLSNEEGDIRFRLKRFNHNTSKFEVHLQLRHDGNGGLEGDLHIATDLFTKDSGIRMVEMYKQLMHSCLDSPTNPIRSHDIATEADNAAIRASNNTHELFPPTNMLNFCCKLDDVAIVAGHQKQSYREFIRNISSATTFLLENIKVEHQERVAILSTCNPLAMAAIYGVVNANCTVVILDPEKTPVDRSNYIFEDAGVNIVLIEEEFVDRFCNSEQRFIKMQEVMSEVPRVEVKSSNVRKDDIFGIFYTSGTTGVPKGVVVSHKNVENLINWWVRFFDLTGRDRVLLFSSLSFIMSLRQYIPTLCAGASIVCPESSLEFESAILQGKVNKLVCTPSALAALDIDRVAPTIEMVQVAGEAPRKAIMDAWKARVSRLFIGLGPTELCAHAICGEYDGKIVCLGHPAANVRVYVVDPTTGLQAPINVPGELWVAGENVSNGYLNQAELTNKSFLKDPFHPKPSRMYKTGDQAKRLVDGRVMFLGRGDSQLKVNGFRIEKGEILNAVPTEVEHAHVMLHNGVLTIVISPLDIDVQALLSHMHEKIPAYMIPTKVHKIERFPLNKNRKLDIPQMLSMIKSSKDIDIGENHLGSASREEKILRLIWAQSLGLSPCRIKNDDNFFELGGTSLSAVVVSRTISKELETEVSVHDVFEYQTIESLSDYICGSYATETPTYDPAPLHYLSGGKRVLHPALFTSLQVVGLMIMTVIVTVPTLATVYISVRTFIWFGDFGVIFFPLFLIVGCLFHILLVILCKWIMIGKYEPGKAKVFSWMFLKWWLVRRVLQVTRLYTWIFDETPLSRLVLNFLGVKVGRNCSFEQVYLLEPDLVEIGDNCVVEFEVQFATSEIKDGNLELRRVNVGDNTKLGVRSVILGGARIHANSEVAPKATVDCLTSTTAEGQHLRGSPARIESPQSGTSREKNKPWRPEQNFSYACFQIVCMIIIVALMTEVVHVGTLIGRLIGTKYGAIALVVYLGSLFQIISCIIWLGLVAFLKRVLIPSIEPKKIYTGQWFALRKWFLDRLFLSPLFAFASQLTLQTSSTFPWYLSLLGAKVGKKTFINHPYVRTGVELISMGDELHMGMLSYFSTDKYDARGISFDRLSIGDHVSFGQRCVAFGGARINSFVTVGAETVLSSGFTASEGSTTFGSPPVLFTSTAQYKDIIRQSQIAARTMLRNRNIDDSSESSDVDIVAKDSDSIAKESSDLRMVEKVVTRDTAPSRMQDIGSGKYFWLYVVAMILIQGCLPLVIGAAYGSIYYGILSFTGGIRFETMLILLPLMYIAGSLVLMLFMKIMHLGGGSYASGTANFFSFRFFYWHIFADMVYMCTSTIIYPFSGTELYCIWLRIMGAKVGKNVFISPENGGFREIDFMDIGDDCVLMTPNIHAHFTDHGVLQFCPVKLEDKCEINPGATLMPLTKYHKNSRLRPFAVTVKGQHCQENTEYNGNPCKAVRMQTEKAAILFPGLGTQYPGMLEKYLENNDASDLLQRASRLLSMDIRAICAPGCDPKALQDTRISQIVVFVANMMATEVMKRKVPLDFDKIRVCAGFSLGELSALCFAGVMSFDDALRLVKIHADAMATCSSNGAMCNVRGMSRKELNLLAAKYGCQIANVICDKPEGDHKQNVYVLAGTVPQIEALINFVNKDVEDCVVSAKRLRVTGGFHSVLMKKAQTKIRTALKTMDISLPQDYLVYSNVTGMPYTSAEEIRKLLPCQIVSPVEWYGTILDMMNEESVTKTIECGPMHTLSTIVTLIAPEFPESKILWSDVR